MADFNDEFKEKILSAIIYKFDIKPSEAQSIYDHMINECNSINSTHVYRTMFALESDVPHFHMAKNFLERDNMADYFDSDEELNLDDKIASIKFILQEPRCGYVECISNTKLYDKELDVLNKFLLNQMTGKFGKGFADRKFGSQFLTKDVEYKFEEFPSDIVESLNNAVNILKIYCLYTMCEDCVFKNYIDSLSIKLNDNECPMICSILN